MNSTTDPNSQLSEIVDTAAGDRKALEIIATFEMMHCYPHPVPSTKTPNWDDQKSMIFVFAFERLAQIDENHRMCDPGLQLNFTK